MDRRRDFHPKYDEHLGEARRSGTAYSPVLTHADLDALTLLTSQQGVQDGALKPKDGIELPAGVGQPTVPLQGGKPCAPVGLVIETGSEGDMVYVNLTWQKGNCENNGSRFEVQLRRTDDPLEAQFPITRTTAELTLRFDNLEATTDYEVSIVAISNVNIRSDALVDTFTSSMDETIPEDVTGVIATSGLRTVLIRWTDVSDLDVINGNGTYEVQIATDSGFTTDLRTVRANGTVVSISDLSPSTTYHVRVRAIDKSGNTSNAWSSLGSTTTGTAGTTDIAANAITANHIQTGAVTADEIAAGSVYAGAIQADAVTASKLAAITLEVGKYIESSNYVATSTGWRINASGNAEFNNVIVRGTVISDSFQTVSSGARVRMGSALTQADEVQFLGSSGGIGSIRNGQFIAGWANSMRLSAGGIIDLAADLDGNTVALAGNKFYWNKGLAGQCDISGAGAANFQSVTAFNIYRGGGFGNGTVYDTVYNPPPSGSGYGYYDSPQFADIYSYGALVATQSWVSGQGYAQAGGSYNFAALSVGFNTVLNSSNFSSWAAGLNGSPFLDFYAANFYGNFVSDLAKKTNVVSVEWDALADVMLMQPREFDWIHDGKHSLGVIAQELPDYIGKLSENGTYGVDVMAMFATLIRCIQQQQDQIDSLTP